MINRALRLGVVFGARARVARVARVDGVGEVVGARKEPDVSPDVGESPRDRTSLEFSSLGRRHGSR